MKRRTFLKYGRNAVLATALTPSLQAFDFLHKESEEHDFKLIQDNFCADALIDKAFLEPREGDIIASPETFKKLKSLYRRLYRLQKTVGYGHFNTLNLDEALSVADAYSYVGSFPKEELDYFEELFYEAAENYGFFGEKVIKHLTNDIKERDLIKISASGHYLFKGDALNKYLEIEKAMPHQVVLTSGVRNVVKQTYLFLNKAVQTKGNLSIASRSLAPAGYSYHGVSDFDIGKIGFGYRNFTEDFARTREFRELISLGYISIRYPKNNPFGVRFEPWHIKVHSDTYTS